MTAARGLPDFLLARIDADEAVTQGRPERVTYFGEVVYDPARVLAECDAKRRIVEQYQQAVGDVEMPAEWNDGYVTGQEFALKLLALPYADHPDCRREWKP